MGFFSPVYVVTSLLHLRECFLFAGLDKWRACELSSRVCIVVPASSLAVCVSLVVV